MSRIKLRKRIIFFDGDGTIWYPKATKRSRPPYWIYGDTNNPRVNYHILQHLILTRTALDTLRKLKSKGVKLVLLSTHPHQPRIADLVLKMKLKHLKITGIFDECCATGGRLEAKGERIIKLLKKYKLPKSNALMVGDSYRYDYLSAKAVGIDALLLRSSYLKYSVRDLRVGKLIDELSGVLKFI